MAAGPGKYGHITERVLKESKAQAVCLIVIQGELGSGFDVAGNFPDAFPLLTKLPEVLRSMADSIEQDIKDNGVQAQTKET